MIKSATQPPRKGRKDQPLIRHVPSSVEKSTVSVRGTTPTPIDILPFDILREIFNASVSLEVTPSRNREVLRLCQVSSLWREAAIGTCELWSSLTISTLHFRISPQSAKRAATAAVFWTYVETWLERSGIRDLSLSIRGFDTPSMEITGSGCVACLKLVEVVLIPHARRICYLHGLRPHMLWELSLQPLPCLQSLTLDPYWIFPDTSFPLLRLLAPNLRRLRSNSLRRVILSTPENRPLFNQLTRLAAGVIAVNDRRWMQVFSALSNLEAIIFYFKDRLWCDHSETLQETHFLPKLSTLTIVLLSSTSLNLCLWRGLKMPALQTFRVQSHSQLEFTCFSDPKTDLHQDYGHISWTGIRQLSLIFTSLTDASGLERFFSNLPNLEELDIQDCLYYEDFFARLTPGRRLVNSPFPTLPRLRMLTIDIHQFELGNPQFMQFVSAQLVLQPLFRVIVYVSGRDTIYGQTVGVAKEANLPVEIIVWDEKFGSRRDRWKYRMGSEVALRLGGCADLYEDTD